QDVGQAAPERVAVAADELERLRVVAERHVGAREAVVPERVLDSRDEVDHVDVAQRLDVLQRAGAIAAQGRGKGEGRVEVYLVLRAAPQLELLGAGQLGEAL